MSLWVSYQNLASTRRDGGRIPWSEIITYARSWTGVSEVLFIEIIQSLDEAHRGHTGNKKPFSRDMFRR